MWGERPVFLRAESKLFSNDSIGPSLDLAGDPASRACRLLQLLAQPVHAHTVFLNDHIDFGFGFVNFSIKLGEPLQIIWVLGMVDGVWGNFNPDIGTSSVDNVLS